MINEVALHAGAWIETTLKRSHICVSHGVVALHAGAWIETTRIG